MTNAMTSEQMRALADEHELERNRLLVVHYGTTPLADAVKHADWHDRTAAALRAAADQLEAVHGALWGGYVATSAVVRVANARQFLPRLTADTAPQEDRDE